jgi:hypothetical protein
MATEALIRPAVTSDLPRLNIMGAKFFEATGFADLFGMRYNLCTSVKFFTYLIANEQAIVLVGEGPEEIVAGAAALAYPCLLDEDSLTAQECFWWVEPEFRGGALGSALQNGIEDWARGKGCMTMEMGAIETLRPDVLAAAYARKGYAPKERIFCKSLR